MFLKVFLELFEIVQGEVLVVVGGGSCLVKLWNLIIWKLEQLFVVFKGEDGKVLDKVGLGKFVLGVVWSLDGKFFVCSMIDGIVVVFDVVRGKLIYILEGYNMLVRFLVFFLVDNNVFYIVLDDKYIYMYDVRSRVFVSVFLGYVSWVFSVDVSFDGVVVVLGLSDKIVWLWDLKMRVVI